MPSGSCEKPKHLPQCTVFKIECNHVVLIIPFWQLTAAASSTSHRKNILELGKTVLSGQAFFDATNVPVKIQSTCAKLIVRSHLHIHVSTISFELLSHILSRLTEKKLLEFNVCSWRLLCEKKLDASDTVLEALRDEEPFEVRSSEQLRGSAPTIDSTGPGPTVTLVLDCSVSSPAWTTVDTVVSIRLALKMLV